MNQVNKNIQDKYEILINNGIIMINNGDFEGASENFKSAIKLNSQKYQAYINLSNTYILQNKRRFSIDILFDYLLKENFNQHIANHLAKICLNYNLDNEVDKLFSFCKLETNEFVAEKKWLYFYQGNYYEKKTKFKEAISSYKHAIKCHDANFEFHQKLLNLLESTNNISDYEKYLNKAFKLFNKDHDTSILNFYKALLLYRQKNFKSANDYIIIKELDKKLCNVHEFNVKILDLESKINEKLNEFEKAFDKIKNRNKLIANNSENKKYDQSKITLSIKGYKKFFNKENVNYINNKNKYPNDKNLVFLVGFPRSGTTLLDSILRGHSQINVLEEKPFLLNLRHEFFKSKNNDLNSLKEITQIEIDNIRNSYFEKINHNPFSDEKITIDKLPLTIIELGFIKCIFPNCKIILCLRHPCDVVTSCFFSSFKINDAMINFLSLRNTINFYNDVFNLFIFYQKELKLDYFEIKYENIVQNFEQEIKSLLSFLNLPYEIKMKNFYRTAQARDRISTPSYNQVINPLYKTSIGRWQNYNQLKSLDKDLVKWIKKFNY